MKIFKRVFWLVLFFLILGFLVFGPWLKIKKIDCQEEGLKCLPETEEKLKNLVEGKSFFLLSSAKVKEEFLKENPFKKEVEIKKIFPQKIKFQIRKRKPIAGIARELEIDSGESSSSGKIKPEFEIEKEIFLIDENGFLLEKTDKTDLPLILIDSSKDFDLEAGKLIDNEGVIKALEILNKLRFGLIEVKVVRLELPGKMEVWLKNGVMAVFSLTKETDIQVDSLQFIVSRAKIIGETIKKIDLRFEKPVISYE